MLKKDDKHKNIDLKNEMDLSEIEDIMPLLSGAMETSVKLTELSTNT